MISGIDYAKGNDESCNITFVNPEYIKRLEEENKELHNKIDKAIEVLDEILVYDDFSDITQGFGNVKEKLKFYLSECKTWDDFRKKNEILKDSDVDVKINR